MKQGQWLIKHGYCKNGKITKTYQSWRQMRQRCNNQNNPNYKNYGGRGIKICQRWNNFFNFLADMGERPEGLIMDRIDNNGNYEPDNCHWVTRKISNLNSRHIKLSTEKAKDIREMRKNKISVKEIAQKFNTTTRPIYRVLKGQTWS